MTAPAYRLQEIDAEVKPEITRTEVVHGGRVTVPGQQVVHAEFERTTESPGVVEHQPQSDKCDWRCRCQQRRKLSGPRLTPRLNHRYQQDYRAEQQRWPGSHREPVSQ